MTFTQLVKNIEDKENNFSNALIPSRAFFYCVSKTPRCLSNTFLILLMSIASHLLGGDVKTITVEDNVFIDEGDNFGFDGSFL